VRALRCRRATQKYISTFLEVTKKLKLLTTGSWDREISQSPRKYCIFSAPRVVNGSTRVEKPSAGACRAYVFPPQTRRTGDPYRGQRIGAPRYASSPNACPDDRTMVARSHLNLDYLDAELTASREPRHRARWQSGMGYIVCLKSGKTRSEESNSRCDGSANPSALVPFPLLLRLEWEMHIAGPSQEAAPPFPRRDGSLELLLHCLIYSCRIPLSIFTAYWPYCLRRETMSCHCMREIPCSAS
jgi:hypothetical protein